MKNTKNNQEVRNFIEEHCDVCGYLNELKNEYKPQDCVNCNSKILPNNHKKTIKIKKIEEVDIVNDLGDLYDFIMYFDFENSKEVNEFLDKEHLPYHSIYCLVDFKNGEFDLDNARYGVTWYGEDSCDYDFTTEQLNIIKNHVSKHILSNNLGEIKDRKVDLLKKVCEYYGCGLVINPDKSVVLEEFINAEFKNVTDALIYFYIDFLKDDWNNRDDLKLIENLIEDKALNAVLEWMNSYSYSLIIKTRNGNYLNLKVKDLQLPEDDEDYITENTLDYWCKYFIEEIYNKEVEEEIREEWIKKDVEPMELYLSRDKYQGGNFRHQNIHTHSREEDNNIYENKELHTAKLEIKYDINLDLEVKEDIFIITSSFPIPVLLENEKLEYVKQFHFLKREHEYVLNSFETINHYQMNARSIVSFLNMNSSEFIGTCYELCQNYMKSYIKANNKFYKIDNIVDFLKIDDLDEVAIADIEYNFDLKEKDILNRLMSNFYRCIFKEVLEEVKDKVIFDKEMVFVAREYAKRVLELDSTQLKYMDYLNYFKNEVSYEIIDDYIVVFI